MPETSMRVREAFGEYDIVTPYVEEISSQFNFSRRLKVVLDAGNGVAGPVMRAVLERLNVDAKELYFEMDGRFPNHHPDPTVEHNLDDLKKAVVESRARNSESRSTAMATG